MAVRLTPIHLRRDDYRIQIADAGSRPYDPDDWSVDKLSFETLTAQMTISLDAFAHTSNAKARRFFSYGLCPGSAAIDAFTQDWTDDIAWLCPPHVSRDTDREETLFYEDVRDFGRTALEISRLLDDFVPGW